MAWNFVQIQQLIRQLSGQLSTVNLTNTNLQFLANNYYQLDLPRELNIEELEVQHQFPLVYGQPSYDLPGDFANGLAYTHISPNVYINGKAIFYSQDTNIFSATASILFATEQMAIGDGATTALLYTTINQPIYNIRSAVPIFTQGSNVLITDNVETFSDVPTTSTTGTLVGSLGGTGTIDYILGAISVTFATAPINGTPIQVTYHYQQLGVPYQVLFYGRQFIFFPTPDTAYQCRVDAYQQPPAMVTPTDVPIKPEWGELIATGTALKIVRNFGQTDKYMEIMAYHQRELTKCRSDTDNQLISQRSTPRF